MATTRALLTTGLSLLGGIIALTTLHLLITFRRLGPAGNPPLQYNDSTLRDFELLSAAGGLLLFTAFTAIVAGYYELTALQTALHAPAILFTLLILLLLLRWRRRF